MTAKYAKIRMILTILAAMLFFFAAPVFAQENTPEEENSTLVMNEDPEEMPEALAGFSENPGEEIISEEAVPSQREELPEDLQEQDIEELTEEETEEVQEPETEEVLEPETEEVQEPETEEVQEPETAEAQEPETEEVQEPEPEEAQEPETAEPQESETEDPPKPEITELSDEEELVDGAEVNPDADTLLTRYLKNELLEPEPQPVQTKKLLRSSSYNGNKLTGINLSIYESLKAQIEQIAAGLASYTRITAQIDESEFTGQVWTAEDFGLDSIGIVKDNVFSASPEFRQAFQEKTGYDPHGIYESVLRDCPYEMYWAGLRYSFSYPYSISEEDDKLYVSFLDRVRFSIYTSRDYAVAGEGEEMTLSYMDANGDRIDYDPFHVDTAKTGAVNAAVENAKAIVEQNPNSDDYDTLKYYFDTVSSLSSYNYSADAAYGSDYGDPWQLIWVFDGDPDTKVVCEGFSKAFQLLCDMTDFLTGVQCYTVTGDLYNRNGTYIDFHMWNIVRMDDEKNYLVDITNRSSLGEYAFLSPYSSGSQDTYYKINEQLMYVYDDNTTRLIYNPEELTLSDKPYPNPDEEIPDDPGTDPDEEGQTPEGDPDEEGQTPTDDPDEEGKTPADPDEEGNTPDDPDEEGKIPSDPDEEGKTPADPEKEQKPEEEQEESQSPDEPQKPDLPEEDQPLDPTPSDPSSENESFDEAEEDAYLRAAYDYGSGETSGEQIGSSLEKLKITFLIRLKQGIRILWSPVPDADGYIIYRKINKGIFTVVKILRNPSAIQWIDRKAAAKGTDYQYKIRPFIRVNGAIHLGPFSDPLQILHTQNRVKNKAASS